MIYFAFKIMDLGYFRRILSFLWPIQLKVYSSPINPILEISLYRNSLHLNSANANYSFGSLHKVMRKGLKIAQNSYNSNFNSILMLGYGGGSAAKLILKEFNSQAKITAVEIDPVVIQVSQQWFPVGDICFVNADAEEYLKQEQGKFDLIICDVFVDLETPQYFKSAAFYQKIGEHLNSGGVFFQNLMIEDEQVILQFNLVRRIFQNPMFVNVVDTNRLFFGQAL